MKLIGNLNRFVNDFHQVQQSPAHFITTHFNMGFFSIFYVPWINRLAHSSGQNYDPKDKRVSDVMGSPGCINSLEYP